jgi:polysaccharide biosynthesis/export protein
MNLVTNIFNKYEMLYLKPVYFLLLALLFTSACASHKDMILFRKGDEKILPLWTKQNIENQLEIKLQANDVIAVAITALNQEFVLPYNFSPAASAAQTGQNATSPATFIVPKNGEIDFPNIGVIKVIGLSVSAVKDSLKQRVSQLLESPSVNVRLVNFKVNVLGEVARPGTVQIENERITILEAITRCGDFTPYSDRENVTVFREENGSRVAGKLNFKSMDVFQSPYFYLQQNDMIYVEPKPSKVAQVEQPINRYLIPAQTTISFISLFRK